MPSKTDIQKANIEAHTSMVNCYLQEPHYKTENIKRVSKILKSLQERTWGTELVDLGCGRGFIIDIAKNFFKTIVGIDITQAMLDKVNTRSTKCNIKVLNRPSDSTGLKGYSFDVCTSYAVLHHLDDIKPTLTEAYRLLNSGGILYTDLDPNYYFWKSLKDLPKGAYSPIIKRELKALGGNVFEVVDNKLSKKTLKLAEYLKYKEGGFVEEDLIKTLELIGFKNITINYNWFLGEGYITHNEKTKDSIKDFQDYMTSLLPLSRPLFKYLSIVAVK